MLSLILLYIAQNMVSSIRIFIDLSTKNKVARLVHTDLLINLCLFGIIKRTVLKKPKNTLINGSYGVKVRVVIKGLLEMVGLTK